MTPFVILSAITHIASLIAIAALAKHSFTLEKCLADTIDQINKAFEELAADKENLC